MHARSIRFDKNGITEGLMLPNGAHEPALSVLSGVLDEIRTFRSAILVEIDLAIGHFRMSSSKEQ